MPGIIQIPIAACKGCPTPTPTPLTTTTTTRSGQDRAPHRCVAAFTLIEILLTVAMLGLAGMLVVPYVKDLPSFEAEAAVRRIVSDLTFAQSDAIARQQKRRVLFAEDGSGYRLLGDDFTINEDELYDPLARSADQRYIINFTTDERFQYISIESTDFDSGNLFITYDELGGPINQANGPSTGGTIIIVGKNQRFQITIAPFTGSITVTKL